jgi:hypothetical protein
MQVTPELLFAAVVAAAAFLIGVVYLRSRTKRTRSVGLRIADGPANLRFACAGCSGQFTHSRRTLTAWKKGNRQFFCNACHTKWRGSHTLRRAGGGPPGAIQLRRDSARKSGAGCLGITILLVALPMALAYVVRRYA